MIMHLVAEGYVEEVVASCLLPFCGHQLGTVNGKKGCEYVRRKAVMFRHLATHGDGVLVLTDFRDSKENCVPAALNEYVLRRMPSPPDAFLCRFAVNEIESWLLADREGLAKYIGIAVSRIPLQPEHELFPKRVLVNLARHSKKRLIREGIAPPDGHQADVGPEYISLLSRFTKEFWNIEAAMNCAQSLERCVRRLRMLEK